MSRRREQRESAIKRATQEVLGRGLSDPRIRGLITVTGVRVTEDGKQALISVSVLPADREELTMHGLRAATPHIRRDVMKRIRIREMPTIEFRLDESIRKQAEVMTAINRASADRKRTEVEAESPPANDLPPLGPSVQPPGFRGPEADEAPENEE